MTDLHRALFVETLGTALLVTTVIGSGIMAQRLSDDTAVMLLANTIATGAILFVLIGSFDRVSGAHFNPVVTLVAAMRGHLRRLAALAYGLAQVVGAMLGAILAHLMFDLPVWSLYADPRSGTGQWLSEGVASFGLILTILLSQGQNIDRVAARVGLYITAAYWFTASTSYANPAVTIGRVLTDSFAGIRLVDVPMFILAQTTGAIVALFVARLLQSSARQNPA